MKLTLRVSVLFVLVLAAAAIASADSLTLNNAGGNIMGGVYVGPYSFTDTSTGQSLQLICDDFKDEVYLGESWTAIPSTLTSVSNGGSLGTQTQYEEVAWLVEQMSANITDPTKVGDIQWAIWAVFEPQILNSGGDPYGNINSDLTGINGWLSQAENQSNYANGNYANLTIYTPVAGTQSTGGLPQEYFNVPEPSSLALLVAGMVALMLLVIRRGRA